mgnify:CR=1 FL=1
MARLRSWVVSRPAIKSAAHWVMNSSQVRLSSSGILVLSNQFAAIEDTVKARLSQDERIDVNNPRLRFAAEYRA